MIFIFIYYIMDEILKNIYYDVKTGYTSKEKLYKKAKLIDENITLKIVNPALSSATSIASVPYTYTDNVSLADKDIKAEQAKE